MRRIGLVAILAIFISLFYWMGADSLLTFSNLKEQYSALKLQYLAFPVHSILVMSLVYIVVSALSLPGSTVLTIACGAIFGPFVGVLVAALSSTVGAACAMVLVRTLFGVPARRWLGDRVGAIQRGVDRDGRMYLLSLRLIPIFPFFLINAAMGLTSMALLDFIWISFLGMLPGTTLYAWAGTRIAQLKSPSEIFSPSMIVLFTFIGLFPWLTRWIYSVLAKKKRIR